MSRQNETRSATNDKTDNQRSTVATDPHLCPIQGNNRNTNTAQSQSKFELSDPESDSESTKAAAFAKLLKTVEAFRLKLPEWWKNPNEWQLNKEGGFHEKKPLFHPRPK